MLIRGGLHHWRKQKKPPYMGWYGRWIFPYIEILVTRGLGRIRRRLLVRARGRVVEIGAGAAQNMEYLPETVDSYLATDPSPVMVRRAGQKIRRRPPGFSAEAVMAEAERMPVADHSADTVVSFLVLCSVHDPFAALGEVHRILRPGGRFLFFEHVLATGADTAGWQNRINPVWKRLACGCHLNRDTAAYIEKSGFTFEELLRYRSSRMGPAITSNVIEGSAGKNQVFF